MRVRIPPPRPPSAALDTRTAAGTSPPSRHAWAHPDGDLVRLRPVEPGDAERFAAILAEPSVARWWTLAPGGAAADWLADGDQATFAIEHEGDVIGSIQYSEVE